MSFAIWLLAACGSEPGAETETETEPGDRPPPSEGVLQVDSAGVDERIGTLVRVRWTQDVAADVYVDYAFGEGGSEARRSPVRTLEAGTHEEVLLGIPYGEEVDLEVVADTADGEIRSAPQALATDPWPEGLLRPDLLVSDPAGFDPSSRYVFTSIGNSRGATWWVIVDRSGRAVWGLPTPRQRTSLHPRLSWDEDALLLDHNAFWGGTFSLTSSIVQRMTIDGTVLDTYELPGLHHPFTDLPDGRLAYGRLVTPLSRDEELTIASADGALETRWSCQDWLASIGEGRGDCGSNTLWYDAAADRFLYSFYGLETIVEIDGETGDVPRWFGAVPGAWAFDPPESAFLWQHGGHYTEAGTLLTSAHSAARDEIVVREYALDPGTETLTEVYQFGVGDGLFGDVMGEAHRLPNGNTLHNTGSLARLREARPDGTVVWDLSWAEGGQDALVGRSTVIEDLYALR